MSEHSCDTPGRVAERLSGYDIVGIAVRTAGNLFGVVGNGLHMLAADLFAAGARDRQIRPHTRREARQSRTDMRDALRRLERDS